MIRATSAALLFLLLAGIAFFGVLIWCGVAVHSVIVHLDMAAYNASVAAYNANGAVGTVNDTLASLNAPCKDFQGDWVCGPIPQLSQTEKNIGILAAKSAQQVRQSASLVNASTAAIQKTADAATRLLGSAQRSTDAIPATLDNVDALLGDTRSVFLPGLEQSNADFQGLLESHAIQQTFDNAAAMTGNANGILADGRKVADKAAADFLKPVPWYMQPIKKSSDLLDIGAAIARHVP
jgi:hypothetical protein